MGPAATVVKVGGTSAGYHQTCRAANRTARAVAHSVLATSPATADVLERLSAIETLDCAR